MLSQMKDAQKLGVIITAEFSIDETFTLTESFRQSVDSQL